MESVAPWTEKPLWVMPDTPQSDRVLVGVLVGQVEGNTHGALELPSERATLVRYTPPIVVPIPSASSETVKAGAGVFLAKLDGETSMAPGTLGRAVALCDWAAVNPAAPTTTAIANATPRRTHPCPIGVCIACPAE